MDSLGVRVNMAYFSQCVRGHAGDRKENQGAGKYWSGALVNLGELKKFLLIFMIWLSSHCLSLPAPVSTGINILPLHSLFGEGEFSSIY